MTFSERQNGGADSPGVPDADGRGRLRPADRAARNVANLLLARAAHRSREISVRVSLGATPLAHRAAAARRKRAAGRSSAASSASGCRCRRAAVRCRDARTSASRTWIHFTMDGSVFAFLAAVTLGTGILFGLAPALHVSKTNVNEVLKEGGRTGLRRHARAALDQRPHRRRARADARAAGRRRLHDAQLPERCTAWISASTPRRLLTMQLALPDRKYPGPRSAPRVFQAVRGAADRGRRGAKRRRSPPTRPAAAAAAPTARHRRRGRPRLSTRCRSPP